MKGCREIDSRPSRSASSASTSYAVEISPCDFCNRRVSSIGDEFGDSAGDDKSSGRNPSQSWGWLYRITAIIRRRSSHSHSRKLNSELSKNMSKAAELSSLASPHPIFSRCDSSAKNQIHSLSLVIFICAHKSGIEKRSMAGLQALCSPSHLSNY